MKYFVIMIVTLMLGLQSKSQDQISFGEVRYDGFNKITKKAYWSKRPEAKEVYEGRTPAGVTVYEIDQDYLARFTDDENNGLDRNYIIFPKGQRVYKKGNTVYAAICGNKLEYFKPLVQIKIINGSPLCENRYKVKIYRAEDEYGRLLMQDSIVIDGYVSKDCRNIVDTMLYVEVWRKQIVSGPSTPVDEMPSEKPAEKKDQVVNNTTNYYTTNIYNSQPQRPIYRQQEVRRGGFWMFLGWRGGGISTPQQTFQPRYDPSGLGGGGTRWDPPGNGGNNPRFDPIGNGRQRQVFDPAGIGG